MALQQHPSLSSRVACGNLNSATCRTGPIHPLTLFVTRLATTGYTAAASDRGGASGFAAMPSYVVAGAH